MHHSNTAYRGRNLKRRNNYLIVAVGCFLDLFFIVVVWLYSQEHFLKRVTRTILLLKDSIKRRWCVAQDCIYLLLCSPKKISCFFIFLCCSNLLTLEVHLRDEILENKIMTAAVSKSQLSWVATVFLLCEKVIQQI